MAKAMRFKLGDHVAGIGTTGSGKTTWSKALLTYFYNLTRGNLQMYIIDSKQTGDFKQFEQKGVGCVYFGDDLPPLKNKDGSSVIVWKPESDDLHYDEFFKMIYQSRKGGGSPCVVYIDEVSSICGRTGNPFGRYYGILLKQGRGLGVSVLTLSQSAKSIPFDMLRNLMHCVCFNLFAGTDKKRMEDIFGDDIYKYEIVHDHGFIYRNVSMSRKNSPVRYYSSYKEFFGIE